MGLVLLGPLCPLTPKASAQQEPHSTFIVAALLCRLQAPDPRQARDVDLGFARCKKKTKQNQQDAHLISGRIFGN